MSESSEESELSYDEQNNDDQNDEIIDAIRALDRKVDKMNKNMEKRISKLLDSQERMQNTINAMNTLITVLLSNGGIGGINQSMKQQPTEVLGRGIASKSSEKKRMACPRTLKK
jgi:hypothetical protein